MTQPRPDALVVGGGVIGLSIAWRAAAAGLRVTVVDSSPIGGASWAAAGMLTPVTEAHYGEEALLALNLESARRYPQYVAELEAAAGCDVGYRTCGTLAVAATSGDMATLSDLHRFQMSLGLRSSLLGPRETRSMESLLAPGLRGGLLVDGDHQVDNRRLARALLAAALRSGVAIVEASVSEVRAGTSPEVLLDDGRHLVAGSVVLAAGCWTARISGLPVGTLPPVRPVKGQILRLGASGGPGLPSRNLRGMVDGSSIYLVPRLDGELVIGATVEEQGYDTKVTAGAVYGLLRDATGLWPGVSEMELMESYAGLRPGSPDNAPMIGASAAPGIAMATGHYRNGILLAPVTADAIVALLSSGAVEDVAVPFSPMRFEPHMSRTGGAS